MATTEERTLLKKEEAFVYKIPPQTKAVGWKATDWNLDNPDWKGKLRLVTVDKSAKLKLEERGTDKVYAVCPIEIYPGPAVQSVADSSRYFVIKVVENAGGKGVHLGLGFADRSDSFDLNIALHNHFNGIQKEEIIEQEKDEPQEKLDLSLKEGETIKVNINMPRKATKKTPSSGGAGRGLAAPPGPKGSIPGPPSPAMARLNIGESKAPPPPAGAGGSQAWIQF